MKIIQVAHAVTKDDGASRHLANMDQMLRELGYETACYAHKVDPFWADLVKPMGAFQAEPEDLVIYQMTTGTSFNKWVWNYPRKIVLYYHNITPAKFFFGNAWGSWWKCLMGRRELKKIVGNSFFGWGASEYSRRELGELGLHHTSVMPAVVDPAYYAQFKTVPELFEKYSDGWTNILYVGRGVPHKKQDEAIRAVAWYKKNLDERVRLLVVGGMKPSYKKKLDAIVAEEKLQEHVIFTDKIPNDELCTLYRVCDAVLCLSEHEGFCVPLVEGMIFEKPVVAYACAAVPETLGKAGVLLETKEPETVAQAIYDIVHDKERKQSLRREQKKRLEELSYQNILRQTKIDMEKIIELWKEAKK